MPSLTTGEAAASLSVTRRRIQELIRLGTLVAVKRGRDWHITSESVEAYRRTDRRPGRKKRAAREEQPDG